MQNSVMMHVAAFPSFETPHFQVQSRKSLILPLLVAALTKTQSPRHR